MSNLRATSFPLRVLASALLLTGLVACVEQALVPAQLHQICRNDGDDSCPDWAWAGEATDLLLLGTHLAPTFQADLGNDEPHTGQKIRAWLGDHELEEIFQIRPPDGAQSALSASLPANLSPGLYSLRLELPSSGIILVEDAFELRSPLVAGYSLQKAVFPVGDQAVLRLDLHNQGNTTLELLRLDWSQEGLGLVDLPGAFQTATLIPGAQQQMDIALEAQEPGRTLLSLQAIAKNPEGIILGQNPVLTIDLAILDAASLQANPTLSPNPATVDQALGLEVTVENTGGVGLSQVNLLLEQTAGQAQLDWLELPEPVDLLAGGRRILRIVGTARSPGQAQLQIRVEGVEDISGILRQAPLTDPLLLTVVAP
ncbi:MAG: hypothetical protein JRF33_03550 [Deltaproteobacteria bacterium]|nr:hypothetical protein [Deltaproteobacteria bacterium]